MKFTLTVEMNNAAFETANDRTVEMTIILLEMSRLVNHVGVELGEPFIIKDINGNTVGTTEVSA